MSKYGEFVVTNCDPEVDLPQVVEILRENDKYTPGQDDEEYLRPILQAVPSTILVAKQVGSLEVAGSVYVNFPVPVLGRLVVAQHYNPYEQREITRCLYNKSFDELRDRGARQAEDLFDWGNPRQEPPSEVAVAYAQFGFYFSYDMFGVSRPLYDQDGNPTPDIPPFD